MKEIRIKIGDMREDMKKVFKDPSKGNPGTHTIYVKNEQEMYNVLEPKTREGVRFISRKHKTKK